MNKAGKSNKVTTVISIALSCIAVLFFALTREAYAVALVFMMLMIKGVLVFNGAIHFHRR